MEIALIISSCVLWAFVSWTKRDVALGLLILLLPIYQIRFSFFGIPSTLLEVYIGILFICWLASIFQKKQRIDIPHLWLALVFIAAGGLAVATSVDIRAGLGLFKAYIVEPVLIYCVVVTTIQTKEHLRRLEWGLIGLVLVVSLVAVLQGIGVVEIPEPYASEDPARVTSVFSFPTAVGKLIGPLIAFFLPFILFMRSAFHKGMKRRLAAVLVVALFGTASLLLSVNRGAILGVVFAGLVLMFFSRKRLWLVPLVVIIAAGLFFVPFIQTEVTDVLAGTDTSTDVRIIMWQGTWRLLEAHPFFGSGLGGFPTLYDEYRDAAHVELFPNPDNFFLTVWTEMGMIGIAIFALLLYIWARSIVRILKRGPHTRDWLYGLALLSFLVALFIHGIVDTPYFKNDLAILFWVLFGIVALLEKNTFRDKHYLT